MPVEVIMPKVDMDMTMGRIMVWHAAAGDRVKKGQPLFDIETDKAAMEVEAAEDGILHHIVAEGTEVCVGQPVAWLYGEGEEVGPPPLPTEPAVRAGQTSPEIAAEMHPEPVAAEQSACRGDAVRATPRARSLARAARLDLTAISGSGPRGRIQRGDVQAMLDQPKSPASAEPATLAVTRSKHGVGTPVVLLHGFASDATSWAPLEGQLKGHPLIRIDLPGHGRSPISEIRDFADLAAQVRHSFDALDLDRAHVVGHSLGGALALALADTRPRRVASLTLIATGGLGPDINGNVLSGICRATRAASLGPWLRMLVADERIVTDSYVRLAMTARQSPELRAAQTALADRLFPDGVQAFDLRPALDRVAMPVSIVWGRDDAIIPWKHALRAPGRVALHLFDHVGHLPQIEAPEEVGKIIAGHL